MRTLKCNTALSHVLPTSADNTPMRLKRSDNIPSKESSDNTKGAAEFKKHSDDYRVVKTTPENTEFRTAHRAR